MTGLASNALEAVRQAEEAAQKKWLAAKEEGEQLLAKTKSEAENRLKSLKETLMQEEAEANRQAAQAAQELLDRDKAETEARKAELNETILKKQEEVVRALIHLVVE